MKKNLFKLFITTIILIFSSQSQVFAQNAMSDLEQNINNVIKLLKDSKKIGTPDSKKILRKQIFQMALDIFDFPEMSQRTLGKNWKKITPDQQKIFSDLFARFLANIYYNRLEEYTDEKVKFIDQHQRGDNKTLIKTLIVTKSKEIPMDYSLVKKDRWRIYDVSIEGVSLVRNYRSQFKKILRKNGINDLIAMMKKKLGQFSNI